MPALTISHYLSILFFLLPGLLFAQTKSEMQTDFITVKNTQFLKNGTPYYFLGTNLWYGMNLGIEGDEASRERLLKELDQLQSLGVNNLRIMAASEGPDSAPWRMSPSLQPGLGTYNEKLLKGLDFLLAEMGKREMHAVVCLNNMWPWSGGFAQYINWVTGDSIPYPPPAPNGSWMKYINYSARFFKNKKALDAYYQHVEFIVNRINSISGIPYKDDPTIMSWQLANEPRAVTSGRAYRRWIKKTAALIKKLDTNHLVSIGSEGDAFIPFSRKFKREHRIRDIDYTTMHIWIQNWSWYDPANPEKTFSSALDKAKKYIQRHTSIAEKLNKPIVLEEFGIARDNENYNPDSPVKYRDRYYTEIFKLVHQLASEGHAVAGANFWAWAGEGRPRTPKAIWKPGDDFIGDPPFEYQGWYSIYNTDTSTLKIIKDYASMMTQLK